MESLSACGTIENEKGNAVGVLQDPKMKILPSTLTAVATQLLINYYAPHQLNW